MSCDFDLPEHCAVLDRLRLPLPNNHFPHWRLHVVQLRPGAGDRVYNFFGAVNRTAPLTMGCFALYPDDVVKTAGDTAEWCRDAWPLLRRTPGPHRWQSLGAGLNQFVSRLGLFQLKDSRMLPWSTDGWFIRFDEGSHTLRHFAWFAPRDEVPPGWAAVQDSCLQLARHSLSLDCRGGR